MTEHGKGGILIVDDEPSMGEMLTVILEQSGHVVESTTDPRDALRRATERDYDLVIQDMKMPGMSGVELLAKLKVLRADQLVIVMTAFSSWDTAVEAMRLGAYDYIKKPFDNDLIRSTVAKALEQKRVYEQYGGKPGEFAPVTMIGASPGIKKISEIVRAIAKTDSTVLVTGESGTGKEMVARSLHASSLRAHQPFIAVNCGAFTESLLESELFGHVRGAFTGAVTDKKGLLELADGGTLFLDEIGEMPASTQVKFLRVLEDRRFYAVGGSKSIHVDIRIIAATNRNLEEEIASGNFREDLFYRLNVIPVVLPPLRDRREDIPLLAGHFLAEYARRMHKSATSFTAAVMREMMESDWPGNIRELENVIHRAVAFSHGTVIDAIQMRKSDTKKAAVDSVSATQDLPPDFDLEREMERIERVYMEQALQQTDYHMTRAARLLNMTFRAFRYKVKKYGIPLKYERE